MTFLADPRVVARRVAARVLRPPPPVDLNAWATANIVFGAESPFPGPYTPDRFPFFRRILETLSPEHPTTMVVIRKSAQLGGTVLAQIFVGGILDQAPQPVFYVHPTDGNAKKWKRNKFAKMVKGSTALSVTMQPEGARSGNSAMYWSRRDGQGYLQLAGANSPSQLSMDSYPIAIHDDMAKWLADNGSGDPEVQADSRTKAFLTTGGKILKISTPDVQPGCRITRSWSLGTRERYHVPCPHCGAEQALEWANMLAGLDESDPDAAHFTCVHCGGRIEERHRDWMNRRGRWVAENPGAEVVSFYLWAAYSPLESWANIAKAWLRAKGNPEAERTFLNDNIGEAYQTATAAPDWQGLRDRAEAAGLQRGTVPRGMLIVTIGCDCQIDRIEWQAVAWGPRLQRVVIDYGIIHHHVAEEAAHRELNALVDRTWPDSFGGRRPVDVLAIDGGAWTDDVHTWARRAQSSKVIVVKGARADSAPPLKQVKHERRPDGKLMKAQKRWFMVGVSGLKASLYANLKKTDPLELGFIGFVAGLDDEFYRELTSEVRKPHRLRDGATEWRWVPMSGVDQEALDTHLYAQAAAIRTGWATKSDEQWDAADELMSDVGAGIVRGVSLGYRVAEWSVVGRRNGLRVFRAVKWTPSELSFTPVPVDPGAIVRSKTMPDGIETFTPCENCATPNGCRKMGGCVQEAEDGAEEPADVPTGGATRAAVNQQIRSIASVAGLPSGFADGLIDRGATVDQARAAAFAELSRRGGGVIHTHGTVQVGTDHTDPSTMRRSMADALAAKLAPALVKPEGRAREFMGYRALDMLAELSAVRGQRFNRFDQNGLLERALGAHGTSDFPLLLQDAGNKILMAQYQAADPTYRKWAARRSFNDFKPHKFLRVGDFPSYKNLAESGEVKYGTMGENREQVSADEYATGIIINRRALINDDLSALSDFSSMIAIRTAADENRLVYTQLVNNPVLSDGKALFHADHGNLGAAAALAVASFGLAVAAMRKQKSLDGIPLNPAPCYLVVGPDGELSGRQLLAAIIANQASSANPWSGMAELVVDANITGAAWYLFADPNMLPTIVYGYVAGTDGPQIKTETDFDTQAIKVRSGIDFGNGAIDFRGAYRNPGS